MAARRSRRISIRAKLLLLVLALLSIPWMGYKYVRETKLFLLQGQEDALLLTARAVSTVFHDRADLFSPDTGVAELLGDANDVYAHQLDSYLVLDGEESDWGALLEEARPFFGTTGLECDADFDPAYLSFEQVMGYRGPYLYALFRVADDTLVYRNGELPRLDNSDHLRIAIQEPGGLRRRFIATASAPGRMNVYLADKDWRYALTAEPVREIVALLRETGTGYTVEMRIPRFMVSASTRIGFSVADVDDAVGRAVTAVVDTARGDAEGQLGRLRVHSPEIAKILRGIDKPVSRIWILDNQQRVRAVMGSLSRARYSDPADRDSGGWFDRLVASLERVWQVILQTPAADFEDISTEVSHRNEEVFAQVLEGAAKADRRASADGRAKILMAAYPIWAGDEVLGAVVVEQSSNEVLALQHEALRNVTAVTLLVFAFVTAALLIFASRLTLRITRLRDATERAITPEGRVQLERINVNLDVRDEVGDLSRSISGMLGRLSQYTRYLEAMPDTLAHEFSNPLNVVHSSLDNLQKEVPGINGSKYMDRAKNGIVRLGAILTNLTEAANLEEAMQGESRERFDLVELVSSYVEGYRLSHPEFRFDLDVRAQPLWVEGSPDHIAQMLDKLADNAVDFGEPYSAIVVRLDRLNGTALLSVLNEGPVLPEEMRDRLFDPMISVGKKHAKHSRLGLGLYVVRLIAEFHHGHVEANNRNDAEGAMVTVRLPLAA